MEKNYFILTRPIVISLFVFFSRFPTLRVVVVGGVVLFDRLIYSPSLSRDQFDIG